MLAGPNPKKRKLNPSDSEMVVSEDRNVQKMKSEIEDLRIALT